MSDSERGKKVAEWQRPKDVLTERETEWVKDQLSVMGGAEVVYSDGKTSFWGEDLAERYEELVNAFGGEDVDQ